MPHLSDVDILERLFQIAERHHTPPPSLLDIAAQVLPGYHPRPHTDYLAEVLTDAISQAEAGEDVRIIVEMPPGEGKSSICSVAAPLYALSRNPDWEIASVSAEASLANKWSRDCRRAVTDGHVHGVQVSSDSKAQTEWETTAGGSFIARGVGGQITGRRIRFLALDDPVRDWASAHSRIKRDALWDIWQSVLKTRMRPGSVVVLVMTRWHEDDLAGRLINAGGWTVVKLPAIAETNDDAIGRQIGEPLLSPQKDETPAEALARWGFVFLWG